MKLMTGGIDGSEASQRDIGSPPGGGDAAKGRAAVQTAVGQPDIKRGGINRLQALFRLNRFGWNAGFSKLCRKMASPRSVLFQRSAIDANSGICQHDLDFMRNSEDQRRFKADRRQRRSITATGSGMSTRRVS